MNLFHANGSLRRHPAHEDDSHAAPPPSDELDALLRDWHSDHHDAARRRRDEILARAVPPAAGPAPLHRITGPGTRTWMSSIPRWSRAAAVIALAAILGLLMINGPQRPAYADGGLVQVPDGGRLDAFMPDGTLVGPCPLRHTDVAAEVGGFVSRVTVTQTYANPYPDKIEAVYTFPLSHRAAVDRMRMIVRGPGGERIVEGEVKERSLARQMYESARRAGFVASLLEQERPNIFTQSVANIEPGAEVKVEISYVETLQLRDGTFNFDFPMVVGPRYIPGSSMQSLSPQLPAGLVMRRGVVLLGPAQLRLAQEAPDSARASQLLSEVERGIPIAAPSPEWQARQDGRTDQVRAVFMVAYADGSQEPGTLRADGTGEVAGRWFWTPGPAPAQGGGTGFSPPTNKVPDADRITPMPVRPPERAGHDVSVSVTIDAGGPAITDVKSELHKVQVAQAAGGRTVVTLESGRTIPNRDFVLSWKLANGGMVEGVLAHRAAPDGAGAAGAVGAAADPDGFFMTYLVPPARVEPATVRPRELVFVMDTSGSMSGFPIEKSKEVINGLLRSVRPGDTFNLITFSGDQHVLWPECRPATPDNVAEAMAFVNGRRGGGGTEMMKAIDAALCRGPGGSARRSPAELADLPADGRAVEVLAPFSAVEQDGGGVTFLRAGASLRLSMRMGVSLPALLQPPPKATISKNISNTQFPISFARAAFIRHAV